MASTEHEVWLQEIDQMIALQQTPMVKKTHIFKKEIRIKEKEFKPEL